MSSLLPEIIRKIKSRMYFWLALLDKSHVYKFIAGKFREIPSVMYFIANKSSWTSPVISLSFYVCPNMNEYFRASFYVNGATRYI